MAAQTLGYFVESAAGSAGVVVLGGEEILAVQQRRGTARGIELAELWQRKLNNLDFDLRERLAQCLA